MLRGCPQNDLDYGPGCHDRPPRSWEACRRDLCTRGGRQPHFDVGNPRVTSTAFTKVIAEPPTMRSHSTCTLHASNTETRLVLQVRTRFAESKVPEPLPAAVSASWGIVGGSFLQNRGSGHVFQ